MVRRGRELTSSFFADNRKVDYLPVSDKYLSLRDQPKYRFNVIGCGVIGHEHIRVTMLEGRGTVHGIYDVSARSAERAEAMFSEQFSGEELIRYDSLEAACNDPDVDGLIICTPNYTHLEIVREAVKSGKHVLLEKPMATTLSDAQEVSKMARNHSSVFQIGLQYRHKAIYMEAIHEALERKAVGDIKTISILEHRVPFLDKVKQWNKFSEYSGGTLVEKCCHYFDLLNMFAGSRPKEVYATGSMAVNFIDFDYESRKADIVDNAFVTVVYANGVRASFDLCMFSPMLYEEIVVCGDEGRLKAYENEDFLPEARPSTYLEVLCSEDNVSKITTPCYPEKIQGSGHHGSTYYEHKYFIDNIEGRERDTATAEEGFWSIVVGVAAEKSIKEGQIVYVDELLEENAVSV